ncbi:NAD(P)H-quinone oxidoreductase [Roseiterribacter gracilis]|uniref:Zinc-binding dehydrogenase n=1 Tax=Roseiterribacter gracilis TaxID=2812848 RepID=A0A8S8XGP0_9PROT|nr:zinc-binding dehydrogenase [Rhodospirillales bacterium TMPK1]
MAEIPQDDVAIEITTHGGPEVLRPVRRPVPQPGPNELLVRVAAAGVNRPDLMQRAGQYPPPPGASDIPGLEVAGTVAAIGAEVRDVRVGDEVCALVAGGGYARWCIVPAPQALPIPRGLSMIEAAALPETFFTVWRNVFDIGGLRAGETALVHGGASGIGTTAIQMIAAMGATAIVTAGTVAKCAACRTLGAAHAINYATTDFVEATLAATDKRGVDLVLDMVGGDYVSRNLQALAEFGRHVSIATQHGHKIEISLVPVMRKRLTLTGSVLRARSVAEKGAIAAQLREKIWPLLETGRIKPQIWKSFPLEEAAAAHAALEGGEHVGKVVLAT